MKWKWVEWSALSLVVITVMLGGVGYAYEQRAGEADREALSIPGRIVPVDGFGMHLHCTGVGSPTVVLEAGTVGFAQSWDRIQGPLSGTTRVCSYDRAGLGWSEDWGGHDGRTIAHNLRALLHAGGEAGPFVVVGHSLGASFARIFAGAYPEEVVGLAMLDPTHPDQLDRFGSEIRADQEDFRRTMGITSKLAHFGVLRAFDFVRHFEVNREVDLLPGFDPGRTLSGVRAGDLQEESAAGDALAGDVLAAEFFLSSPTHLTAAHAELLAWEETMDASRAVDDLGDLPLTVISSNEDPDRRSGGAVGLRHRMHAELAALSDRGQHLEVKVGRTGIFSLLTGPKPAQEVTEHLRAVVEEARGAAPSASPCDDPARCWTPSGSSTE